MDIFVLLMRGATLVVDDNGQTIWCPFEYEFEGNMPKRQ
jgi:hypothetical protein